MPWVLDNFDLDGLLVYWESLKKSKWKENEDLARMVVAVFGGWKGEAEPVADEMKLKQMGTFEDSV